jgi:hypothetical protein
VTLFNLGQLVATPGVLAALETSGDSIFSFVQRHVAGDWGEVDKHDRREDELSLEQTLRLLSVYRVKDGTKIYVITEGDRSSTGGPF